MVTTGESHSGMSPGKGSHTRAASRRAGESVKAMSGAPRSRARRTTVSRSPNPRAVLATIITGRSSSSRAAGPWSRSAEE